MSSTSRSDAAHVSHVSVSILSDLIYTERRIGDCLTLLVSRGERLADLEQKTSELTNFTEILAEDDTRRCHQSAFLLCGILFFILCTCISVVLWWRLFEA